MYVARNELSRSLFFFSEKIQLEWNKSDFVIVVLLDVC